MDETKERYIETVTRLSTLEGQMMVVLAVGSLNFVATVGLIITLIAQAV